jgi:hypothetical protein
MQQDRAYDRGERDEIRRGERMDAAPRERYGNEEDAYSREYRRAYPEQRLERRLHDDSPYNRPGYEPEMGRPGGRENVDLDRTRGSERSGRGQSAGGSRGHYDEQWRGGQGGDIYGYDWERPASGRGYSDRGYGGRDFGGGYADRGQAGQPSQRHAFETSGEDWTDAGGQDFPGQGGYYGQGQRYGERPSYGQLEQRSGQRQRYGQQHGQEERQQWRSSGQTGQRAWQSGYGGSTPGSSSGSRQGSPYDHGEVSSWYGGDTGMGDPGSSLDRPTYGGQAGGQYGSGQYGDMGRGRQQGRGAFGQESHGQGGFGQARRGPFSGRGPRGYQRSDERIREDVCELLTYHGEIDASSMEVEVRQGTVILRGMVDSGRVRRLTEEAIEEIPGVRDVENQLRVNQRSGYSEQLSGTGQRQDNQRHDQGSQSGQPQGSGSTSAQSTPAYGTGVAETSGVSTRSGPGEPGMSAGAGPSQHGNRWQIRETMDVVGSDGESVGTVKTVRGTDFQVNRPRERDLYVPFSAVQTVDSERVMLSCRASEVDGQNWPAASLAGGA